jgi:hypothetical protein
VQNFPRCTPVRGLHAVFNLPYLYDYITKFCRRQAEVIHNHENEHVRGIGQDEAVIKLITVQVTKLHKIRKISMICYVKPVLREDLRLVHS